MYVHGIKRNIREKVFNWQVQTCNSTVDFYVTCESVDIAITFKQSQNAFTVALVYPFALQVVLRKREKLTFE